MLLSHNNGNLEDVDTACMSVDFHGRPSSLSRFMEGQGRARDGFNDDVYFKFLMDRRVILPLSFLFTNYYQIYQFPLISKRTTKNIFACL